MNRVLYALIGSGVAIALAVGFFEQRMSVTTAPTDIGVTFLFCAMLAGGLCVMIFSPWGRRLRVRCVEKQHAAEDRAHEEARIEGKVRKQMPGPLP